MPTYKVTDPKSGKTVSLTGDSPPTEAELNDIFSSVGTNGASLDEAKTVLPQGDAIEGDPGLKSMGPLGMFSIPEMAQSIPSGHGIGGLGSLSGGLRAVKGIVESVPSGYGQLMAMLVPGSIIKDSLQNVGAMGRGTGNFLADVVGAIAGKDPEAIKVLIKNPRAMWQKANQVFSRMHQESAIKTIEKDFSDKGAKLGAIEDTISGNFGTPSYKKAPEIVTRGALDETRFKMGREGFRMPDEIADGIPNPKIAKIAQDTPEYKFLIENLRELKKNPRMNFGDALRMRRNIDKAIDYGLEGANGMQPISEDASRILKGLRKNINKEMRASLQPNERIGWDAVNKEYEIASASRSELRKQVMGTSARNTEKKLNQLLKEGRYDDEVMNRAKDLGAATAKRMDDIRQHISARQMHRWAHGMNYGHFLPSSPKAVGYGASAVGGASNLAEAVSAQVQNRPQIINALINEHMRRNQEQP